MDNFDFELVETDAQLESLVRHLKNVPIVALDTEADSFHHYRPHVCLIQVSFDGHTFIVDPLASIKIDPFLKELSHKELIIHDAGYDLRMLKSDFGFKPAKAVFDTMLAAALTGKQNIGLAFLLEHVLDMTVAKHNQRADWSKRPLSDHLLQYAAEDTTYLMQVKHYLQEELQRLGRIDWHLEFCKQAVKASQAEREPIDPDNEWRIKGSGKLSANEMAFVRAVWYWREGIAKKTNIAPFMICRNTEIIKLANWAAKRKSKIETTSHLPIRCKKNERKNLIASLQTAQNLPPEQWPGPRKSDPSKRLPQSTLKLVNELKAECETIADNLRMQLQWIAPRAALTQIVLGHATTLEQIRKLKVLMDWQVKLILPAVQKVLTQEK
jgi:ribonuclease D